ncbi:DUF4153 domain-containing protein [Hathewaya massiliensis]|uniref:DUF4153 domain-containing protein n=1 Tax=Hathewaya massiliensis TaxID=1964382 RepID=UPI0011591927|nr:DUF4173 domain-containing protein [Hathewaya massiliensis]
MKDILSKQEIQSKLKILFMSIFIGVLLYDFMFYYKGLSYFILISTLTLGFIFIIGIKNKNYMGYFLMGVSVLLSSTYFIYTNPVFRVLNRILIPCSLISAFIILSYKEVDFKFKVIYRNIIRKVFIDSFANIRVIKVIFRSVKKENNKESFGNYKYVLNGLMISIPIVIVLITILADADKVFAYYIKNLNSNMVFYNLGDKISRIFLSIIFSIFIFGLYNSFSLPYKEVEEDYKNNLNFNSITIVTILFIVSFLYLVFTKIQISYLYIGTTLPQGFNYAEYARSGFFQLIFLTLLNVFFIIFIKKNTVPNGKLQEKIILCLYSLITILTFNMAFSALYKMRLYIVAFGFTRLRILSSIFTIFLCMVLIVVFIFIFKNINMFKPIVICGAIIYVFINFANIDDFITRKNLQLAKNSTEIDISYIVNLSFDNYNSMESALKKGEISKEQYHNWLYNNKIETSYWHEYNYFNSKGNSVK